MPSSVAPLRVLLLVETSHRYGRAILAGIGEYACQRGGWLIEFEERGLLEMPGELHRRWRGDGIITRTAAATVRRWIRRCGVPAVELLGLRRDGPAKVHADNALAARLAVRHLADCGLTDFGFFTLGQSWWIDMCREGFAAEVAEKKCKDHVFQPRVRRLLPYWQESHRPGALAWLDAIPKPIGVVTSGQTEGVCLLNLCRQAGIAVPEQVAIVSASDDPMISSVTTPPLSGIDLQPRRIGYEAAALMDRMMSGEPVPASPIWIPPLSVVARQSSNLLAVRDPALAAALQFIRENACCGIDVSEVAKAAAVSRRVLERRFRERLKRSPKAEILRVRVETAKRLLADSNLSIQQIADRAGFASYKHFAEIFRRATSETPRAFRAANGCSQR